MKLDGYPGEVEELAGMSYDYSNDADHCPLCGAVGWTWGGWFSCDGPIECGVIALVKTGQVFRPMNSRKEVSK